MSRSNNSRKGIRDMSSWRHPCWHCESKDCPHTPIRDAKHIGYGKSKRWNWRAAKLDRE